MRSPGTGQTPALFALLTADDRVPDLPHKGMQDGLVGPGYCLLGTIVATNPDQTVAAAICGRGTPAPGRPSANVPAGEDVHAFIAAYSANEEPANIAARLRGNEACVIVDSRRKRMLALGDRMGTQRLYYSNVGHDLRVSTDLPWVAESDTFDSISKQAIYDYVYFHVIPAPRTVFTGAKALPIGSLLRTEGMQVEVRSHRRESWTPRLKDPKAAARQVTQLLRNAVENSLPEGAAKTACFLSGGLDSSSVAGFAAQVLGGKNVHAFSIGFSEKAYDESEFAAEAARQFDLNWHRHELTPSEVVDSLDDIVGAMPEPFGNSSAVAVYHCALQARQAGFDLMLAGDGGDEIFGGNSRYAKQFVFERYSRVPAILRTKLLEPTIRLATRSTGLGLVRKAQSYIEQANVPLPDRLQSYNYLHRNELSDVFTSSFLRDVDSKEPLEMLREEYHSCRSEDPLDRMLQLDWRFTLHDNDLVKVNSMCRLAGIDPAYPMLDREVVDFACRLPGDWKIRGGDLRWFYRMAMRGFLPDTIIDKKKHGFGLPFGVWTRTHGDLQHISEMSVSALSRRGIFQEAFLQDTLRMHRDVHAGYYGELIWILMILEMWQQKHAPDVGV